MWKKLKQAWLENQFHLVQSAGLTFLVWLLLWLLPQADWFKHWSFDLPTLLKPARASNNIVVVQLDELSLAVLKQSYKDFNRTNHARLLKVLTQAPARLVVFDVYFPENEPHPAEDPELAKAIAANGHVVLAGEMTATPDFAQITLHPPLESFRLAASNRWGIIHIAYDTDRRVRFYHPGPEIHPSLSWAAAEVLGAPVTRDAHLRQKEAQSYSQGHPNLWLRYYREDAFTLLRYADALEQPPEFFRDKIVFIGGKPSTLPLGQVGDNYQTPLTHWNGLLMSGVTVHATSFLNVMEQSWFRRMTAWHEFFLFLATGLGITIGLGLLRPLAGLSAGIAVALLATAAGCYSAWYGGTWFSWLLISGVQVPCAYACATGWYLHGMRIQQAKLLRQRATHIPEVASSLPNAATVAAGAGGPAPVEIDQYRLLKRIGKGAYGEVFLARNAIGLYYALKVVYRSNFSQEQPYEREFKGIEKYMPISLNHKSLAHLLHVGRNDQAGYFYYVMEIGDDRATGTKINPESYTPRNLSEELRQRGRLPVPECIELFLPLTEALMYLHREKLIHRDIKPSNIIFVKGIPKFADIGLVTEVAGEQSEISYVGTEGYIPPEGPGTPQGDIFSLGIVLYQAATGLPRHQFPELPGDLPEGTEIFHFMQLNKILLKAAHPDVTKRYATAAEMHSDLLTLQEKTYKEAAAIPGQRILRPSTKYENPKK